MKPPQDPSKRKSIAFVLDDRLPREKALLLNRITAAIRHVGLVTLISGGGTEAELLERIAKQNFDLVMAPWYRYLAWSKVEAFYGLTRTSGPTFAGYFCDQLLAYELGDQADHLRAILIDFSSLTAPEIVRTVYTLLHEDKRSGILPFLQPHTPIYCESWMHGSGLGNRMDTVLALPEIAHAEWSKRSGALRTCLSALWSLVYEDGPGKSEFNQGLSPKTPRAYFQVAADSGTLVFRLCYSMPNWSPKDTLAQFWPNSKKPSSAAQLLLKYCDFLRVHTVADVNDIEVVAGYYSSAPSEVAHASIHTLWVEPIAQSLVTETPMLTIDQPEGSTLKALAMPQHDASRQNVSASNQAIRDRFMIDAAKKIRDLKHAVAERDQTIRELRVGGVGPKPAMPMPEAEDLLEAFQERYFDAKFQIRQFELQIAEMQTRHATKNEIEALKLKMAALANREQAWIAKISNIIEQLRQTKRGA